MKRIFFAFDQDVIPDLQNAASAVLVALGRRYCNHVMEDLLVKFQPGILPHFFVVETLGNLATANGRNLDYCVRQVKITIITNHL